MPSSRDKRTAGQLWAPNGARLHNAFVDATGQRLQPTRTPRFGHSIRPGEILIYSDDGLLPGSLVGFGDPQNIVTDNSESQFAPILEQAEPETARWAIAVDGIQKGGVAPVLLKGVAWAEVNVNSLLHEWVDAVRVVESGIHRLETQDKPGYARVLYSSLASPWCLLDLGYYWETGTAGSLTVASDCLEFDGGIMIAPSITITGPTDTSPQFAGWSEAIKGDWQTTFEPETASDIARQQGWCLASVTIPVPNNAIRENQNTWPTGPLKITFFPIKETVELRFWAQEEELIDLFRPAATRKEGTPRYPRASNGLLVTSAKYATWQNAQGSNTSLNAFLNTGKFTIYG